MPIGLFKQSITSNSEDSDDSVQADLKVENQSSANLSKTLTLRNGGKFSVFVIDSSEKRCSNCSNHIKLEKNGEETSLDSDQDVFLKDLHTITKNMSNRVSQCFKKSETRRNELLNFDDVSGLAT